MNPDLLEEHVDEDNVSLCGFSLDQSSKTQLRSHWLCFPNTRKESGMLFMSVPPHQGDEWVLLISCVRGWHLLFPLAASRLQLSFHRFREDGRENARQPEIMRRGINWRSVSLAFPPPTWLCQSDPSHRGLLDGPERKKKVKDGNYKSCSVPGAILLASPSVYANAKRFIYTLQCQKFWKAASGKDTAGERHGFHRVNNFGKAKGFNKRRG